MKTSTGTDLNETRMFGPEMRENPYLIYQQLRSETPVCWNAALNAWILTRYDDVSAVLNDPRFSSNRLSAAGPKLRSDRFRPLLAVMSHKMSEKDEPDHTRLRSLVNRAFSHVAVEQWERRVQQRVDDLLGPLCASGRCEFMEDFAVPLPLLTIMELVGIPVEDRRQVKRWCDDFAFVALNYYASMTDEELERGLASIEEFRAYLLQRIDSQGESAESGLLGALVAAEHDGLQLSLDELLANAFLLLSAGNETTTCLLGNGLAALMRFPEQFERLRAEPALVPHAVEEFLRFDSPVQFLGRLALEDVELRSQRIRRGELVLAAIGAANRDPEKFSHPDTLDIGREHNPHLSFGHGRHFCVGSQFTRLESRLAFQAIVNLTTEIALDGLSFTELVHRENFNIRQWKHLPIRIRCGR